MANLNHIKTRFDIEQNSLSEAKSQQLLHQLDSALIQKFEDLKEKTRDKYRVTQWRSMWGKTVEFLRTVAKLKKSKLAPNLKQLRKCMLLSQHPELQTIQSVRKEKKWVHTLFQTKVAQYRQGLQEALEQGSAVKVFE